MPLILIAAGTAAAVATRRHLRTVWRRRSSAELVEFLRG